jgi:hypothetical protein
MLPSDESAVADTPVTRSRRRVKLPPMRTVISTSVEFLDASMAQSFQAPYRLPQPS